MKFRKVKNFPDILTEEVDSNNSDLSPAQIEYFKKSKIRDTNNNLLVCYHGTTIADYIDTLDVNSGAYPQKMVFFSDSAEFAISYATRYMDKGQTFQCYLNIENPLVIDARGRAFNDIDFNGEIRSLDEIALYANKNGYDGVIAKNVKEYHNNHVITDIITFRNNQIKLTTNKNPTTNDNMRK